MTNLQYPYDELFCYTLTHTDPKFIHQHVVDAVAAQTADADTKPIKLLFALIGLYLYLEKNYTGKEVQIEHMQIGNNKMVWPTFVLPENRGEITVSDVLRAEAGEKRDAMIFNWCVSVWDAYKESHKKVANFINNYYRS